jgi:hypothetical protein
MTTPPEPAAHGVRIDAQPGDATVTIDGTPLPRGQLTGYVLQHDIHQALPSLILHTRQPESVLFEGLATVAVAVDQSDATEMMVQFLQGIDPAALQRVAMDRDDLDDGKTGVTEAILRQLVDWVQGQGGS